MTPGLAFAGIAPVPLAAAVHRTAAPTSAQRTEDANPTFSLSTTIDGRIHIS